MNDEKLIRKIIQKHLKETKADAGDATDGDSSVLEMAKAVWEQGYPALRDVFAQRIQLPKGITSHVVPVPEKKVAGDTWAESVDFVAMEYITVVADQKRSLNFGWNHEYLLMATWEALAPQLSELGRAIEESIFKYCIDALAEDADEDALTDPTTYALFVAGIEAVNKNDYNCDTCIVSIETYFDLLADDKFINVSVMGSADPIKTGRIQTTLGVTVFASSVLSQGMAVFFDSKKALCMVEVGEKITEEYGYPDDNLFGVVGRTWFGAKVILPKAVAVTAATKGLYSP
jgi:hypothetical protein